MHYAERKKPDSNDDIWFDSYSILKMAELQKEKKMTSGLGEEIEFV